MFIIRNYIMIFLCVICLNGQTNSVKRQLKSQLRKAGLTIDEARQIAKDNDLIEANDQSIIDESDLNNDLDEVMENNQIKNEIKKISQKEESNSNNPETLKKKEKKDKKFLDDIVTEKSEKSEKNINNNYFGYDVFKNNPNLFQSSTFGVLSPDYLIGPGDEIVIMLWGETEIKSNYIVSRDGDVFIKNLGKVYVNGLTLEKLEKKLLRLLKRVYSSLESKSGDAASFFDVSLGEHTIKPNRIFVLGELLKPGAYSVDPSATFFTSLYYFNGPTINGSLRNIKLLRDGQEVSEIDAYDYLLSGKQKNDLRLNRNDVIFIPQRGKTVSVSGEIGREASYELKKNEGLKELIRIAGNIKPTTYMNRVQIDRIIPSEERSQLGDRALIDVNLNNLMKESENFELIDGDSIKFFRISDRRENTVTINGSVNRPGNYDLGAGLKLLDLIEKADGLLGVSFLDRADIIRENSDGSQTHIDVNLRKLIEAKGRNDISLSAGDNIIIYNYPEMTFKSNVTIRGHVLNPGQKQFKKDMELFDLIFEGGGFKNQKHLENTYFKRSELTTWDDDSLRKILIPFRLDSVLAGKGLAARKIKMGDEVRIYSNEEIFGPTRFNVSIEGNVKRPGIYELSKKMRLKDLLFKAGGFDDKEFLNEIYLDRADLIRVGLDNQKNIIPFNVKDIINDNDSTNNFLLKPKDLIRIYSKNIFKKTRMISIDGAIRQPGDYLLKENMSLKDLILEAGGVSSDVPSYRIDISRLNLSDSPEDYEIKIITLRLKNEKSVFNIIGGGQTSDGNIYLKNMDLVTVRPDPFFQEKRFVNISGLVYYPGKYVLSGSNDYVTDIIERAGGLMPEAYPEASELVRNGELISLSFKEIIRKPWSSNNFIVVHNDSIVIKGKPNLVKIEGEVHAPGNYQYFHSTTINQYIKLAGGITPEAARSEIYVTYPNGTSKKISIFRFSPNVLDGSVITIGKKAEAEPFNFTEYVTNVTAIWSDLTQAYLMIALAMGTN